MEFEIDAAVLHVLDTAADAPVLSEQPLPLNDDTLPFLTNLAAKAFASDETKSCTARDDSAAAKFARTAEDDFAGVSAQLAKDWFALMQQNPAIPAGDAVFLLGTADAKPVLAALKLNYKAGFVHYFGTQDNLPRNELVRQPVQLPAKADEAFFLALPAGDVRVLEKPYEIDGHKECYLAARLLDCRKGLSPKEKLSFVKAAAAEVNQKFYGSLGVEESDLAAAVCDEFAAADDGVVPVQAIAQNLYADMPHAQEAFREALAEHDIAPEEALPLSGAAVRRLEKQSLRSGTGVEVKVPVNLYKDKSALEFIHNDDGTTSLLIKNILV